MSSSDGEMGTQGTRDGTTKRVVGLPIMVRDPIKAEAPTAEARKAALVETPPDGPKRDLIRSYVSTAIPPDPFMAHYWNDGSAVDLAVPISPLEALEDLNYVFSSSSILTTIAAAVARNVELEGWRLAETVKVDEETPPELKTAISKERQATRAFFTYLFGSHYAFEVGLERCRTDLEATGWRGLEVLRLPPPESNLGRMLRAEQANSQASPDPLSGPTQSGGPPGPQRIADAPTPPGMKQAAPAAQQAPLDSDAIYRETDYRGTPIGARHVEARTLRYCGISDPVTAPVWRLVGGDDSDDEADKIAGVPVPHYVKTYERRRWRLLVQDRSGSGLDRVYFQEFGDPRIVDNRTGEVIGSYIMGNLTGEWPDMEAHPPSTWANELLLDSTYDAEWAPYGAPWWYGQSENVLGIAAAEEGNRTGIQSPKIPHAVVGVVGHGTVKRLEEKINKERDNNPGKRSELVYIEIDPPGSGSDIPTEGSGQPKGGMVVHELHPNHDDMYGAYLALARKTVRSRRGLSAQTLGESEDNSFASAEASLIMDDEQVFQPEGERNARWLVPLLHALRVRFHIFEHRSSRVMSPDQRLALLKEGREGLAITPNAEREVLAAMLGADWPQITEPWGDKPAELVLVEAKSTDLLGVPTAAPDEGGEAPGSDETDAAQKSAGGCEGSGEDEGDLLPALQALKTALLQRVRAKATKAAEPTS